MAQLTPAQVYAIALDAGWTGKDAVIATAVALAESGGRTDAVNKTNANGSRDYGLWQVNHPGSTAPTWAWSDPLVNARKAHTIWQRGGWGRWSTYSSGSYLKTMPKAQRAASGPLATFPSGQSQAVASSTPITSTSAGCRWSGPFGWCMDKPVAGLAVTGGALLALAGVAVIAAAVLSQPGLARPVAQAAGVVGAPVGAVREQRARRSRRNSAAAELVQRDRARGEREQRARSRSELAAARRQVASQRQANRARLAQPRAAYRASQSTSGGSAEDRRRTQLQRRRAAVA